MRFPNLAGHPERNVPFSSLVVWVASIGRAIVATYG
jgi:hypothetical protein